MSVNSIRDDCISVPEYPTRCQEIADSKCFKYTKIVLFVIFALNMMAWGNMLFFIALGAANNTMPDERTRKMWTEIASQIINALAFIMIVGLTPGRVRDLYHLYREKHRPKLLQRHSYTDNLIWLTIILWSSIANSIFQMGMAVCMWSMDMYTRPAWLVGIFGGLSLASGVFAALTQFILGRRTKKKVKIGQELTNIV